MTSNEPGDIIAFMAQKDVIGRAERSGLEKTFD